MSSAGPTKLASYVAPGAGDVVAPGGEYYAATRRVQDAVLGAHPNDAPDGPWARYDAYGDNLPGLTVVDAGQRYIYLNGTAVAAAHAAGVAALVVERHPNWSPSAVIAAVRTSAPTRPCPARGKASGGRIRTCVAAPGVPRRDAPRLIDAALAASG